MAKKGDIVCIESTMSVYNVLTGIRHVYQGYVCRVEKADREGIVQSVVNVGEYRTRRTQRDWNQCLTLPARQWDAAKLEALMGRCFSDPAAMRAAVKACIVAEARAAS